VYPVADQVSDIHVIQSEDIRANARRRDEEIMEELRKEALHRQRQTSLQAPGGFQHTHLK